MRTHQEGGKAEKEWGQPVEAVWHRSFTSYRCPSAGRGTKVRNRDAWEFGAPLPHTPPHSLGPWKPGSLSDIPPSPFHVPAPTSPLSRALFFVNQTVNICWSELTHGDSWESLLPCLTSAGLNFSARGQRRGFYLFFMPPKGEQRGWGGGERHLCHLGDCPQCLLLLLAFVLVSILSLGSGLSKDFAHQFGCNGWVPIAFENSIFACLK